MPDTVPGHTSPQILELPWMLSAFAVWHNSRVGIVASYLQYTCASADAYHTAGLLYGAQPHTSPLTYHGIGSE